VENGAERAENWVSGNGAVGERRSQKTMERGARSGNREKSGCSRSASSVERLFWPLTLRSHTLLNAYEFNDENNKPPMNINVHLT